jgi:hypothetical protein
MYLVVQIDNDNVVIDKCLLKSDADGLAMDVKSITGKRPMIIMGNVVEGGDHYVQ